MTHTNQTGDIALLLKAYSQSNRRQWITYRQAARVLWNYARGKDSTRALADELRVNIETLRLWACAGSCRIALRGLTLTDENHKTWTLYDLRRSLSLHHFMVAGRYLHAESVSPTDLFEWLVICGNEGKSAEWLAAQIAPVATNQFDSRFQRLFNTQIPAEWPEAKRQACRRWLSDGRKLLGAKP